MDSRDVLRLSRVVFRRIFGGAFVLWEKSGDI